jgi:hypothetical protein
MRRLTVKVRRGPGAETERQRRRAPRAATNSGTSRPSSRSSQSQRRPPPDRLAKRDGRVRRCQRGGAGRRIITFMVATASWGFEFERRHRDPLARQNDELAPEQVIGSGAGIRTLNLAVNRWAQSVREPAKPNSLNTAEVCYFSPLHCDVAVRKVASGATPTLQEVHDLPLGISEPSSRTPSTADLNVSPRSRSTSKARSAKQTAVSISR